MPRIILIVIACLAVDWLGSPPEAFAQPAMAGCKIYRVDSPVLGESFTDRRILTGTSERPVQIDCDEMQFFADSVELLMDQALVRAQGHVLFVTGGSRISAERMEFNTKTRTGTFYTASGTVMLGERVDRSLFGTQEPDAFFYGEEVQKLGPKKYRVVRGGFTTCVQPEPRWEMVSGSATLNLDDYALLRNTVFRVKGVPVLYLPVFYYPIQEDDRATGFVIPIYGNTTVQGHSIKNAFFWAIGRSHDATLYHDWYSKTGQGFGGEYRYVLAPGSQGDAGVYLLNEHETETPLAGGGTSIRPAQKSYTVRGTLSQRLPAGLYARANANYFSSVTTQQRYEQNLYNATNRTRSFDASMTGNWGAYALSATAARNDIFYPDEQETIVSNGALPRVTLSRGERPIGRLRAYFGVTGEYVTILRNQTVADVKTQELGLTRLDVTPTLRIPFTKWPFLTVNSSIAWRGTYWTESLEDGARVAEPIGRRYFDVQARITGPVFNRIFDTEGNTYASRFKHVIEPSLTVQRVTAIENRAQIVQLEGPDYVVGNVTRFTYSLANRLYAKKEVAREILTATISQSYYTDQTAVDYDRQYQSSFSGTPPSHFSAVAFTVRTAPTDRIQGQFRTEWDPTAHALRTLEASGSISRDAWLQAEAGWSQRRFIPTLPGFNDPARADHYLNALARFRTPLNRLGATYGFNYDIRLSTFARQQMMAYYNAQCCGVVVEYQTLNYQNAGITGVPQDRRFNVSFSLAGIGTFSNFFGALGGGQQRR